MKPKKIYFICILLCINLTVLAQTHIWMNTSGDQQWSNPDNWDTLTAPSANSNVLISGDFEVIAQGTNNGGTITIQNNAKLIVSGVINVTSEIMIQQSEIEIEGDGSLQNVGGTITIQPNAKLVVEGEISSNPGGIIVNNGMIELVGNSVVVFENQTIENNGTMLVNTSGITNLLGVTLNNNSDGVIEIPGIGGFLKQNTVSVLNNFGLVVKKHIEGSNGNFYILAEINNRGIIDIEENETFLLLSNGDMLTNFPEGKMIGEGTFDITSNFLNQGTFSPGDVGSPATINVVNDFSLNDGTLELDLIDPNNFDTINVTGNPSLEGNITLSIGYFPTLNDTFTILTSTHTISNCNFDQYVSVENDLFTDYSFRFETICNQNSIQLRLESILVLNNEDEIMPQSFLILPNPITTKATFSFASEIITKYNPRIEIYTMLGQKIKEIDVVSETTVFERDELSSGIYIVKVRSEDKVLATRKLVLQ